MLVAWLTEGQHFRDVSDPSDRSRERLKYIHPGQYELDEIPNPFGHEDPWFVIRGTKIGMSKRAWEWSTAQRAHTIGLDPKEGKTGNDPLVQVLIDAGLPEAFVYTTIMPRLHDRKRCDLLIPEANVLAFETAVAALESGGFTHGTTRLTSVRLTREPKTQPDLPSAELAVTSASVDGNGSHRPGILGRLGLRS